MRTKLPLELAGWNFLPMLFIIVVSIYIEIV